MMADLGQRRLTDAELLEALRQGINSFPPSHPDAKGMGATQYEVALELRKARAVEAAARPQPVPVSERLPGPGDCDAEGFCWWWCSPAERWLRIGIPQPDQASQVHTHWLPAHDLPLPGRW